MSDDAGNWNWEDTAPLCAQPATTTFRIWLGVPRSSCIAGIGGSQPVMAEEHFEKLIDQMVVEEVPYFCQLEDGSPPGELFPHEDPAGLNWAIDFATGDVPCRLNCRTSKWASPLLLDFPRPEVLGSTCGWLKEPDADSMIANAPQTGAPTEEGEVDYEAFRVAAAETLDSMLLNILDDVITGKLNWTRPLSKPRSSGN